MKHPRKWPDPLQTQMEGSDKKELVMTFLILIFMYLFIFVFSRAAPMAYGNSQARGPIGPIAASLCHSNIRFEPSRDLHHSSQQCRILNTLS